MFTMFVLLMHALVVGPALNKEIRADNPQAVHVPFTQVAHADATMESKVEALKDSIVDDLAAKCETRDVKEPDAAIILDSNAQMSIGAWMFQIKTVQLYVKKFEGREIDRVEAIRIAVDHDAARALAKRIIFEEAGGIYNWRNCADRLNLVPQIEVIKKLEA